MSDTAEIGLEEKQCLPAFINGRVIHTEYKPPILNLDDGVSGMHRVQEKQATASLVCRLTIEASELEVASENGERSVPRRATKAVSSNPDRVNEREFGWNVLASRSYSKNNVADLLKGLSSS